MVIAGFVMLKIMFVQVCMYVLCLDRDGCRFVVDSHCQVLFMFHILHCKFCAI